MEEKKPIPPKIQKLIDLGIITAEDYYNIPAKNKKIEQLFSDPKVKRILLYGSSRSGKTFRIVYKIIVRALLYPGSRHLIARNQFNSVKNSIGGTSGTLPTVLKIKFPALYKTYLKNYNATEGIYKLPNGSSIWLKGIGNEKEAERLLGLEFATIYFNEVSEISYGAIQKLLTRLSQKVAHYQDPNRFIRPLEIQDENPPSKSHHSYKEFIELHSANDPEIKFNPEEVRAEQLNAFMNIDNIADDYIESLLTKPRTYQIRFLYGEFGSVVEGAIFGEEIKLGHMHVGTYPYNDKFEVFAAFDIGVSDACAIIFFQYYNDKFRIIDYHEENGKTFPYYAELIKNKRYGVKRIIFPFDIEVREFGWGGTRRDAAEKMGFSVIVAPRLTKSSQIEIARNNLTNCYFNMATTSRLQEVIINVTYKHDKENYQFDKLQMEHDEFSHGADAFIYMIIGTLHNLQSIRVETEEERHKRIYREQQRLIQNEIDHDLERVLDPGVNLANPKRRR